MDQQQKQIIQDSIKDAHSRIGATFMNATFVLLAKYWLPVFTYLSLVEPLISRKIRSRLSDAAHRSSIESFAQNLKSLLLSPPMSNIIVLGLDPGKYKWQYKLNPLLILKQI